MPALTLHYHPLSSYCQKVLIALDVLGVDVDQRLLNLGDPEERAAHLALWPTGKMPLLVDQGRPIPETSIIIEYLQRHHAARVAPLLTQHRIAAGGVRRPRLRRCGIRGGDEESRGQSRRRETRCEGRAR